MRVYFILNFVYVKFKLADRYSRTTPSLSGPQSPLGLTLQRGYNRSRLMDIINQICWSKVI